MERRLEEKLARFRDDLDREPTARERWRFEREAVVDSRPAKDHGHSAAELHADWRERVQALGVEPERLLADSVGRIRQPRGIDQETMREMVDRALAALQDSQSTWRPAEVVRELAAQVPTQVTADAGELCGFLQRLADHVVVTRCVDLSQPMPADAVVRRDGRSISEAATERALTTQAILDEETQILQWAERQQRFAGILAKVRQRGLDTAGLSPGQADAARAVAGVAPLELIVGPAGSGKTTALAPTVEYLQHRGRVVFGVAPTAAAAEVLGAETAMAADTLDKLLFEHTRPDRPPHPRYDLPPGSTLVVDEAGTVATPKLAALARLADQRQWRVVMVGDPRQFSAVGRGGMFAHLVDTCGATELDQLHRFTHTWERDATRRLRQGDPSVIAEYVGRGRVHGGTPDQIETTIIEAWSQARRRGESVALMANTNHTVNRLNHLAQHHRLTAGELDVTGPALDLGGQRLLVGDEVVTRRNQRDLRTDRAAMVKNRDHWIIEHVHSDGAVTLTGRAGTVRVPADYAGEHLELGYAQTSHATQGRTVDTALLLVDGPTDARGLYTPMTRGRHANHAYVATIENETAADILTQALSRDWIGQPAITRQAGLEPESLLAPFGGHREPGSLDDAHRRRATKRSLARDHRGISR